MTHLYGAKGSFDVLRAKNTIKLVTQSAEKWICMGKWAFEFSAELFLKTKRLQTTGPFLPSAYFEGRRNNS